MIGSGEARGARVGSESLPPLPFVLPSPEGWAEGECPADLWDPPWCKIEWVRVTYLGTSVSDWVSH